MSLYSITFLLQPHLERLWEPPSLYPMGTEGIFPKEHNTPGSVKLTKFWITYFHPLSTYSIFFVAKYFLYYFALKHLDVKFLCPNKIPCFTVKPTAIWNFLHVYSSLVIAKSTWDGSTFYLKNNKTSCIYSSIDFMTTDHFFTFQISTLTKLTYSSQTVKSKNYTFQLVMCTWNFTVLIFINFGFLQRPRATNYSLKTLYT